MMLGALAPRRNAGALLDSWRGRASSISGVKRYNRRQVGTLELDYQRLDPVCDTGFTVITYTAEPVIRFAEASASLAASPRPPPKRTRRKPADRTASDRSTNTFPGARRGTRAARSCLSSEGASGATAFLSPAPISACMRSVPHCSPSASCNGCSRVSRGAGRAAHRRPGRPVFADSGHARAQGLVCVGAGDGRQRIPASRTRTDLREECGPGPC